MQGQGAIRPPATCTAHQLALVVSSTSTSPWCSLREFAPFAPTVTVETDASSTGIGAYSPTSGHWFSHTLTKVELKSAHRTKARCMGELELRGVAMAITTFAHT